MNDLYQASIVLGLTILGVYAILATFLGLYVYAITVYQAHLNKTLSKAGYIVGAPGVATMLLVDVVFQYTIVTLLWWEWPRQNEYTVTRRLKRWKQTLPLSRRGRWSANVCKLLNIFTPPGAPHC